LTPLSELAAVFLRLGATAFGGPPAHIALMERELVERRRWLTREQFLDYLGVINLLPGPNSTEMALYVGRERAGVAGLLVAGTCFLLPSAVMVCALAWAYVRFGAMPAAVDLLYGSKPVIIALIAHALWTLGRTAIKSPLLAAIGVAAVVAGLAGVNGIVLLLAAGAIAIAGHVKPRSALAVVPLSLFLFFLKVGAVMFGGGYVLLAFLRADLVENWHWITEHQLLDAIAVSQLTPGPLSTVATFIGYLLGGLPGAAVATAGIFLPAFVLTAASGQVVPRLRRSGVAGAFLNGVNAGALALMTVVAWQLARAALVDWITLALAVASAWFVFRTRVNPVWMMLAGAGVGLLVKTLI
jgi:chromate transporter